MTLTPVLKVGFRVPRADAFSLNQAALAPMVALNVGEQDAAAHWLFGSDQDTVSNFPDLLNGLLLTPTGSPTLTANSVSLPVGSAALTSTIPDAAEQTVCIVAQVQTQPASLGVGTTLIGTPGSGTQGAQLTNAWSTGGPGYYGFTQNFSPQVQLLPMPGSVGQYVWLGMSHAPQEGPTPPTRTCYTSGGFTTTAPGTKIAQAATNISIGGATASGMGPLVVCEAIIFNKHLTAAQMAAVKARSVARLATRGITVV